ncbi:MAG: OmpH family outer membrane protein [Bacteroidales bacterium]|nr:OmpH family outer membrane protein [Bacteroidales bacterium]MCF8387099.1 OmpH family outer membrane protein [Bacteroidales bacterium]MCF8397413.1 OmpH family outer membrane protein [Bacteroidales bacterium]
MKKFALIITAVILTSAFAMAQKYAYVDTDYILNNIPEYKDAQTILDDLSLKWQKEIEDKLTEVDRLYKEYQSEAVLLPEDIKRKREDEIIQKEKEVKELQKKYFGKEGELFKKRKELVEPIQEKVYNAIETISTTENYAFVFDKAGSVSILFANPKYDISDDILDEVGTVMQTVRRGERK